MFVKDAVLAAIRVDETLNSRNSLRIGAQLFRHQWGAIMEEKRSYLLEGARTIEMASIASDYSVAEQLNIAQQDGEARPVVTLDWFASTGSKTAQRLFGKSDLRDSRRA
ncbi:hypothetical protein [Aminobacter sp. BE322]|uniref:hypothetical protein n=1 Tax=unclassified Aminobacter TaxID=2644704 RepID=UPI003D1AB335